MTRAILHRSSVSTDASLTAGDYIGFVLLSLVCGFLLLFPWAVAPAFITMFSDLGGALPALTQWALTPWFAPLLGGASLALGVAGLAANLSLGKRRVMIVAAFLAACASGALVLTAMYLPIFELADAVG